MARKKQSTLILDAAHMEQALKNLATQITTTHNDTLAQVVFIGIVSAGYPLALRLSRLIAASHKIEIPVGKMDVALYRDDLLSRGKFVTLRETDIPFDLTDKYVILVDDVLFHGRTIRAALNALLDFGRPATIALAVLIDRGHRELPILANFVGETVDTHKTDHVQVQLYEIDGEDSVRLEN